MNNLIFGFFATLIVLIASVEGSWSAYWQIHSIVIVFGGTLAIFFFSTPTPVLKSTWVSLKELFHSEQTMSLYQDDINLLAANRDSEKVSKHPLIAYAQELWSQGIHPDLFIVLLSQKRKELDSKRTDAVQAMKNIAKYPPTLGMTGTVMGMISLFSTLDDNKGNIGAALSIAMTATFFGLVLANLLIAPLADRLHVREVQHHRIHKNLYEVLLLINQGEPSTLVKEEMNERAA